MFDHGELIPRRLQVGLPVLFRWLWKTLPGGVGVLAIVCGKLVRGWPSLGTLVILTALLF